MSPTMASGGRGRSLREGVERAGECQVAGVVAGGGRERPVLAPSGDAPVDQARVALLAHVGAQADALHHAGAEPLDEASARSTRCRTVATPSGCLRSIATERRRCST